MTDDPGERQGDILSRHAATPRPPSQEFPMPTVFSHPAPVLALAALLGGRVSTRMLLFGILCAVLPDADVIGFRFGISYADAFGHRGFSHSLAFALLMGCAGFGVAPLFLRGSRLMGFTVGLLAVSSHILLDAMTNGGLGVAAFWPFDQTRYFCDWRPIRVSPFARWSGKTFASSPRPQGAPVATGALRHALRIALGMGSVSGCHSRRLVFREEPYACHPPEITPIPLWRIFQNGVTPIATITHGTLSIRKLNAIKKGMPHTEHPRPAPCRDYR